MPTLLFEARREATYRGHRIRFWFNDTLEGSHLNFDAWVATIMSNFESFMGSILTLSPIAMREYAAMILRDVECLNAVEVINEHGTGATAYRDWP